MTGRRKALFLVSGVAVVAAATAGVIWLVAGGGGSTGSAGTASSPAASSAPNVIVGSGYPASYVIVYQVTLNGTQHWEVLSVQRPFGASDLTYTTPGPPRPGDHADGGNLSTPTGLYIVDSQSVRLVSGRQPGPPSGDEYLGAEVSELTRRGLAVDLNAAATVAGRACGMYRFAGPPSGAIAPAGQVDHDDVCLDADGLELSETWTYHGQVVMQRSAVEVRSSAQAVTDSSAPTAPPIPEATAGGAHAATVTPDSQAHSFIAAPPAPAGFVASGPAVDFRLPDPLNASATAAASVVWAFASGPRVITVEAGTENGAALPWKTGDTVVDNVVLNGLGPASTAVRSDGFELRIDLGGGQWVRVHGTVPLNDLVAYARGLMRAAPGPTAG